MCKNDKENMGFYRKIQKELQEWKDSPVRKPLVLRGARQTGKTTVINQFSKEFDTYIYKKKKIVTVFSFSSQLITFEPLLLKIFAPY